MERRSKSGVSKQWILETIREKILYLEYKPGDVLLDTAIAEELQVSRTPVREALLLLKTEKFVDIVPQSGTFVSLVDVDLIKEVLYVRHILECDVMRKELERGEVLRPRLERYLLLQDLAVRENDQREYVKNDHLFHREIFRLGGHLGAWEMIEDLYRHTIRYHVLDFYDTEVFGTSLEEHRQILDRYDAGDWEGLEQVLELHHDCGLRTSERLRRKFSSYFK